MASDDTRLDNLFQSYRAACPDVEAGVDFMPRLWQKIDARRGFWYAFQTLARGAMTACVALCLLLVLLNAFSPAQTKFMAPSYTDALLADHTAERTDFTEAIRGSGGDESPTAVQRD